MMTAAPSAGLCASCQWGRIVRTARGSSFLRCGRSDKDPSFPRYPPLPVRSCSGYAPTEQQTVDPPAL